MWWMIVVLLSCTSVMAYLGARLYLACDRHETDQVNHEVWIDDEIRSLKARMDRVEASK